MRAFVEHRLERERQILVCIDQGIGRIAEMVPKAVSELVEMERTGYRFRMIPSTDGRFRDGPRPPPSATRPPATEARPPRR